MALLTKTDAWKNIERHAASLPLLPYIERSNLSATALHPSHASTDHIHLDFSYQRVDDTAIKLLIDLAKECRLQEEIHAMMTGYNVNTTENKPALHTALRVFNTEPTALNGHTIVHDVLSARETMRRISEQIRQGDWVGYTGKKITDIVNIGIGGSHLGPQFCMDALAPFTTSDLGYHFISDIDDHAFKRVITPLKPETTLFIVSSKSFTTYETLLNAKKAIQWLNQPKHLNQHFIAVTAHAKKAKALGFDTILPLWDWVGGRYSVCSAINLITCIAIGFEQFSKFLKGAHSMDEHFHHMPLEKNLPVLLALLGIWNNNFLHIHTLSILTYSQGLRHFYQHIQQLDMESNGKSLDKQGRSVNYATGPIIWGGLATQAQHSYFQLLCQGTHKITADLISINTPDNQLINQMCDAHKIALTKGVYEEHHPNDYIPGNIPLNHIELRHYTPEAIGELIALYEHKIYAQSVIWNINPFDQPGVVGLKSLMKQYVTESSPRI